MSKIIRTFEEITNKERNKEILINSLIINTYED
jgi:hypothetical protein